MHTKTKKSYKEAQGFSIWIMLIISGIAGAMVYKMRSVQEWGVSQFAPLILIVIIGLFFLCVRLRTRIDNLGIFVDFKPFVWRKQWTWDNIQHAKVERYRLTDYGGWGYRIGKNGTALTTKGKWGIQIQFKNGERILIGTQRPEEAQRAIDQFNNERY